MVFMKINHYTYVCVNLICEKESLHLYEREEPKYMQGEKEANK